MSYFKRFGFCDSQLAAEAHPDVGLIIVIPCFDEPDLPGSLRALRECQSPGCAVEIIVVVNSSEHSSCDVLKRNRESIAAAREWSGRYQDSRFAVHLIEAKGLPRKHAGVGLARKIGMDEAVRRFDSVGRFGSGIIVCYDADCLCDANYLVEIERHFNHYPETPGCSIYFEHPLAGPEETEVYRAITEYELHLRYYVEACRYAGHPHAFHTIGSSMAVRASAYVAQGGMNKRQAGEDFYFLQKVIQPGGFTELNSTRVIPSPRVSDRVPFGTGKAVGELLASSSKGMMSYPLQAFVELGCLFTEVAILFEADELVEKDFLNRCPGCLARFLCEQGFSAQVAEIRRQTSNAETFRKRFFGWFNAFMLMKFVHFARDQEFGEEPIELGARDLLKLLNIKINEQADASRLLEAYRQKQRGMP